MEEKVRKSYHSDLTDEQWEEIAPLYTGMRNSMWSKRELTDAVLYLVDSGCKWRQLPHDFPPYSTVHSFYRRARISGLWDKILEYLVKKTRTDAGRKESPSYAIIDSQSVKTVAASEERGIDGGKNGTSQWMCWAACCLSWFMPLIFMTQKAEYLPQNRRMSNIHLSRSSAQTLGIGIPSFLM